MMTKQQFSYRVGDLLKWTCTGSFFIVTKKDDEKVTSLCMDGGKHPTWVGDVRTYFRESLTEIDDFEIISKSTI